MLQDGLVYFVALTGKEMGNCCNNQGRGASILTIALASNIVNLILYRASEPQIQVCRPLKSSRTLSSLLSRIALAVTVLGVSEIKPNDRSSDPQLIYFETFSASIGYTCTWIMSQRILIHLRGSCFCLAHLVWGY